MSPEAIELISILKAQQMADAVAIKCLIAALTGEELMEAWNRESSSQLVAEQLAAQSNTFVKAAMEEFQGRLDYWADMIRGRSGA